MFSDRETLCFLQHVPGIGNKTIKELWAYFKTGDCIYHAGEEELAKLLGDKRKLAFLNAREKRTPTEVLKQVEKKGISYYTVFDWNYPERLRKICDAPPALYVRGSLPPENEMTASVVGARKHSYYGEKQTKIFAGILANNQVGVVSGMAKGIDGIAQMTAVEHGGKTYAVLGCGVDICYPPECRRLYERLPEYGGIISEYPPGTQPKAGLFPLRNRIISGLGDILLVMEARQRSGTLITVDMALEQGKEIWALPGRCDDVLSCGCNKLIAQGCGILTGEKEFAEDLELLKLKYVRRPKKVQEIYMVEKTNGNLTEEKRSGGKNQSDTTRECHFQPESELEQILLTLLDYQPMSLSNIYEKIVCDAREVPTLPQMSAALMELCMKGLVKQINGNWYIRV